MRMETLRKEITDRPKLFGNVLGILAAIALTTVGLMIAYDWIVPVVVVQAQSLDKERVNPGETICAKFVVDRYRNCPAVVYQWIFDGDRIQYPVAPIVVAARPLTFGDPIQLCVQVPDYAAPGFARYQVSYTHTCDVIDGWYSSKHTTAMPYLHFTIMPDERRRMQEKAE